MPVLMPQVRWCGKCTPPFLLPLDGLDSGSGYCLAVLNGGDCLLLLRKQGTLRKVCFRFVGLCYHLLSLSRSDDGTGQAIRQTAFVAVLGLPASELSFFVLVSPSQVVDQKVVPVSAWLFALVTPKFQTQCE